MSLTMLLIPLAVGATSALAVALDREVEEGNLYKIETGMKKESILKQALVNHGCEVDEKSSAVLETTIGKVNLVFKEEPNGTMSAVVANNIQVEDAREFLEEVQKEYIRILQEETYKKLLVRAEQEGWVLENEEQHAGKNRVLTFEVR